MDEKRLKEAMELSQKISDAEEELEIYKWIEMLESRGNKIYIWCRASEKRLAIDESDADSILSIVAKTKKSTLRVLKEKYKSL